VVIWVSGGQRTYGKRDTAKNLSSEAHAGDLCATQLGALEAVPVAGTGLKLHLKVVRVDDGREGLARVDLGVGRLQTTERSFGLIDASHADEVPGRFGRNVDQGNEEDGPDPMQLSVMLIEKSTTNVPLERKRNFISPFVHASRQALENSGGDELSKDERHVLHGVRIAPMVAWENKLTVKDVMYVRRAVGRTSEL
jgi:hypothetical protein